MQKIFLFLSLFFFLNLFSQTNIFNSLLQKHVDTNGNVNYKALKNDESKLQSYLDELAQISPDKKWSNNKAKAFWINAYNAYTLKLMIENYPLKSIKQIRKKGKDAWSINFAKIGGKNYTLNQIEHKILRKKYKDPKIHVGVNCASKSCPQLSNIAFTETNYESETNRLMKKFINDPTKNKISENKIKISQIFNWFKGDFTHKGSLIDFINNYSDIEISPKAKLSYLEYDWSLNGK
ncbi:MAG: DUF547 domain-containing protein [Tenacibaculum sp.]